MAAANVLTDVKFVYVHFKGDLFLDKDKQYNFQSFVLSHKAHLRTRLVLDI